MMSDRNYLPNQYIIICSHCIPKQHANPSRLHRTAKKLVICKFESISYVQIACLYFCYLFKVGHSLSSLTSFRIDKVSRNVCVPCFWTRLRQRYYLEPLANPRCCSVLSKSNIICARSRHDSVISARSSYIKNLRRLTN